MQDTITNAVLRRWRRLFPERQIYLRSHGRVRYVALPPLVQFAASLIMFFMIIWVGVASANLIFEDDIIAARDRQLKEIQRAYAEASAEMAQIQQRFMAATQELEAKHRLLSGLAGVKPAPAKQPANATEPKPNPAARPKPDKQAGSSLFLDNMRSLEARLSTINDAQGHLLPSLGKQADSTILTMEKLIALTGLNVDRLLARISRMQTATGGPLIPLPKAAGPASPEFSDLSSRVGRLEMLRRALFGLPLAMPLGKYYISSNFGYRRDPFTRASAFHSGVDMVAPHGRPVRAPAAGRVIFAGRNGPYGNMIELDHGQGIHTRFGHLSKINVRRGEMVSLHKLIGLVGSTGRSSTAHLHYEVWVDGKPRNPRNFMKAGENVFQRQG